MTQGRTTIAAESFQNLAQMCGLGLQAFHCNVATRNLSHHTQMLALNFLSFLPELAKWVPLEVVNTPV